MKKVIFRADASAKTGCGHFVRSLALADMLRDDFQCSIATASPTPFQKSAASSICPLTALSDDDSRFALFADSLCGDEIVVLDNYWYEDDYIKGLQSKGCKVVRLDDFFDGRSCADYTIFPSRDSSKALLRRPFYEESHTSRSEKHAVISMGGSDSLNLTYKAASYLKANFPDWRLTAMVGEAYCFADSLDGLCAVRRGLDASQVAELFDSAALVICSASTVCYEALSRGCAVAAGWYVDNQKPFYDRLSAEACIHPLGNLSGDELLFNPSQIGRPAYVPDFASAPAFYRMLFRALSMDAIAYQDLTQQQSYELWQVRNTWDIRQWMTNPEAFSFESHCNFVKSLSNRSDRMYLAFYESGQFLGSYDLVNIRQGEGAERGLFVNPACQRRQVASMMELLMEYKAKSMGLKYLLADVLKNNQRSVSYHLAKAYIICGEDEKFYHFRKEL